MSFGSDSLTGLSVFANSQLMSACGNESICSSGRHSQPGDADVPASPTSQGLGTATKHSMLWRQTGERISLIARSPLYFIGALWQIPKIAFKLIAVMPLTIGFNALYKLTTVLHNLAYQDKQMEYEWLNLTPGLSCKGILLDAIVSWQFARNSVTSLLNAVKPLPPDTYKPITRAAMDVLVCPILSKYHSECDKSGVDCDEFYRSFEHQRNDSPWMAG